MIYESARIVSDFLFVIKNDLHSITVVDGQYNAQKSKNIKCLKTETKPIPTRQASN